MVNKEPLLEPPNGYTYRKITEAFRSDRKYLLPSNNKFEPTESYNQCILTHNMCYNGDCAKCKVPLWSSDTRIKATDRVMMEVK